MEEAISVGNQLNITVAGIEKAKLQELCLEAAAKEGPDAVCQISNELFSQGLLLFRHRDCNTFFERFMPGERSIAIQGSQAESCIPHEVDDPSSRQAGGGA